MYVSRIPRSPLNKYIERLWACSDTPTHPRERILPSGTFELVINLTDDSIRIYSPSDPNRFVRYPGAVLSGPYSRCFLIDPAQHASIIAVHFKPGCAFPFFRIPAREFSDIHVGLEALWGSFARELRERLCAATSVRARFRLLEEALVARLREPSGTRGVVSAALARVDTMQSGLRVGDLAESFQLSSRHFIQLFSAQVGLTPKLYARIRRFQQLLDATNHQAVHDWAALAVECGYYDQSHMIRDFRAFSGLNPLEFQLRRSADVLVNHVPHVG